MREEKRWVCRPHKHHRSLAFLLEWEQGGRRERKGGKRERKREGQGERERETQEREREKTVKGERENQVESLERERERETGLFIIRE